MMSSWLGQIEATTEPAPGSSFADSEPPGLSLPKSSGYSNEIDKLSDWGGHSALSVLLSILDPSQNHAWQDHFLDGIRLDLSESVSLATANERDLIPTPLLDRLQCVEVPAYSPE